MGAFEPATVEFDTDRPMGSNLLDVARKLLGAFAVVSLLVFACGGSSSTDSSSSSTPGENGGGGSSGSTPGGGTGNGETPPPPPLGSGVGGYPVDSSTPTLGGTMTFTNVGAPGFWPRRINREAGDPACNYKDGTDTWGGHCCMKEEHEDGDKLAPFEQEMTLILKAIDVKQVAVYQPATSDAAQWGLVSSWDRRNKVGQNLGFTQGNDQVTTFEGDLQKNDCVWYLAQTGKFDCGDGKDYYCPNDPGVNRLGWTGSKMFVLLGSMTFDDAGVEKCNGGGASGSPGPWVALVASELIRDGGRKWNGLCNCYSKTGTVGDGCGEINLFEVVMDNNEYSNREFASTGVRSYQNGHVGGNVCGTGCSRDAFADNVEVLDACSKTAYTKGPEIPVGGKAEGCPVWRRPEGDRYFVVLLDEVKRTIQISIIHPANVPSAAAPLLPALPASLGRDTIDNLISMRLPAGN